MPNANGVALDTQFDGDVGLGLERRVVLHLCPAELCRTVSALARKAQPDIDCPSTEAVGILQAHNYLAVACFGESAEILPCHGDTALALFRYASVVYDDRTVLACSGP